MRTTLTLDDDVAAAIERLVEKRRLPMKQIVNELLRAGLSAGARRPAGGRRHRTTGFDLGHSLIGSLDNVAEALARAEGESHK